MDPELRRRFNAAWTPELAAAVRADLDRRVGRPVPFPVAETPLFFPEDVRGRFTTAAEEIVALLSDPTFIADHEAAVPPAYRSPGRPPLPQLAQLDFAVVREPDGTLAPRLVELQGFPSLYAFQILIADVWASHLVGLEGLPDRWRLFFGNRQRYEAMALLRDTIVAGHDPVEVVLLDLEPLTQKTYPDFAATQRWWGVDPVCPSELVRDGRRLYRKRDGKTIQVKRIYHRIVIDELEQRKFAMPFRFDQELDVEWIPHPEWWFIWSKRSLLFLDHPAVPKTHALNDLDEIPEDLDGSWVLKPLWSFAGAGVNVDPRAEDVAAVPEEERARYVLQQKLEYAPAFESVEGFGVKAELRMMFVRPDGDEKMTLLMNLVRLSRGRMMGVDYNKDLAWTGSSVGIWA